MGYAAEYYQGLKHFIHLHIGADGVLTRYPIGVDRVGRKWTLCPGAPSHAPWFGSLPLAPSQSRILLKNRSRSLTGQPYQLHG